MSLTIASTRPTIGGSYRSDELGASAACEPRRYRKFGRTRAVGRVDSLTVDAVSRMGSWCRRAMSSHVGFCQGLKRTTL